MYEACPYRNKKIQICTIDVMKKVCCLKEWNRAHSSYYGT